MVDGIYRDVYHYTPSTYECKAILELFFGFPLTKNAAAALLEQQPYLVKSTELECVFGPGNG